MVFAGTASLAGLAVVMGAAVDGWAGEPCAHLVASPDLSAQWTAAVDDLARALTELPSTQCRPVTLVVESADGTVRLVAQAEDGGRAVRPIAQPSMLVPIALGLVVSGSTDAPSDASAATPPSNPPAPSAPEVGPRVAPPSVATPRPSDAASPGAVGVWLGLGIGARVGAPSSVSMADIEARADLRVHRLLLSISFRNVPIGFVSGQGLDGDAYHESSIAVGVGRSFPLGSCSLDLSIAPSLVTMRLSEDTPMHARANDVELRVGASARVNVPLSPNWRATIAADTDVVPDLLRTPERIDPLPAFPAWTSGLCLGITGEVL